MKISRKKVSALVAVMLLSLSLAAPAAFGQSNRDGYVPPGPSIVDQTESSSDPGEELPFTGLDLGLLAVAGGSLLLLGFGMRRLTRAPDNV